MSNDLRLRRSRDPFTLARSLFGFDPFYGFDAASAKPSFSPNFEVKETSEGYELNADIAGVKQDDIDISLHNNVLTVSGSRVAPERKEGDTYFVRERQYGSFTRSFALPDEANPELVAARLSDGVLSVTIAKKAESKPRKIAIKT